MVKVAGKTRGRPAKKENKVIKKKNVKPMKPVKRDPHREFEIDKIVGHKINYGGGVMFKVRWTGYTEKYDSWEPKKNLENAPLLVTRYMKKANIIDLDTDAPENGNSGSVVLNATLNRDHDGTFEPVSAKNGRDTIVGLTRDDGELKVIVQRAGKDVLVSVHDAFELDGWGLTQFLLHHISFNL